MSTKHSDAFIAALEESVPALLSRFEVPAACMAVVEDDLTGH